MEYREIVAVTGLGGLYQLLTTKSDGAIVRNVADKSTKFISARQHNVTPLESIEVYTTGDNVRLQVVFQKMQEHEAAIPLVDAKSNDSKLIKTYFKTILPEFDEDRVYVSDMKKMLRWYELLKLNDLLRFEAEVAGEVATEGEATEGEDANNEVAELTAADDSEVTAETTEATEPATDVAVTADAAAEPSGEEKAKKSARKKKAEDGEAADEEAPAKKAAKKKKTEE